MGFEGRRKGKYKAVGKFVERMKRIQEEAKCKGTTLELGLVT